MTIEERNKKLKAYITCLKCEVGGKYCADDCNTQYVAGNMGEINDITDAIYRYTRAKEIIKENCYVFNIGDLDESTRINKALDLACTAIDIIIGELEGEKKE